MVFYPSSIINIPSYLRFPIVLAPLYSLVSGVSPFETGLMMTKIIVPVSLICGIGASVLSRTPNDSSNLNVVMGVIVTGAGLYICFESWAMLGLLAFVKTVGSPFLSNFFN
jgi:hypothetical protein